VVYLQRPKYRTTVAKQSCESTIAKKVKGTEEVSREASCNAVYGAVGEQQLPRQASGEGMGDNATMRNAASEGDGIEKDENRRVKGGDEYQVNRVFALLHAAEWIHTAPGGDQSTTMGP